MTADNASPPLDLAVPSEANAAFIAHAREDVPALVAEVRRVTAERDAAVAESARLTAERDRLQRACDEGLPREVILCPACAKPHIEGPRHDDPTVDGRTRPHHTHRCYGCGHVWDSGRWSFGVAPTLPECTGVSAGMEAAARVVEQLSATDAEASFRSDAADAIRAAAKGGA